MTRICEDYDRKAAQCLNGASPFEVTYFAPVLHGVSLCKMVDDKYDQIPDRNQSNNARIL